MVSDVTLLFRNTGLVVHILTPLYQRHMIRYRPKSAIFSAGLAKSEGLLCGIGISSGSKGEIGYSKLSHWKNLYLFRTSSSLLLHITTVKGAMFVTTLIKTAIKCILCAIIH